MRFAIVLAALVLAGCGADGQPQPPQSGVTVSGEARVGVTGKL